MAGNLSGTNDLFEQYGKKYGVDPALAMAISIWETGNGTSNAAKSKNNMGGMMGKNGLMSFDSAAAGIEAMIRNLSKNYITQGIRSIEDISRKYAPIGAANDPTGLNKNWVQGVTTIYNQLRGG